MLWMGENIERSSDFLKVCFESRSSESGGSCGLPGVLDVNRYLMLPPSHSIENSSKATYEKHKKHNLGSVSAFSNGWCH